MFTEIGYDNIMVYIFGPLFGGIAAGLFSHINEWAQHSMEEAAKEGEESTKITN